MTQRQGRNGGDGIVPTLSTVLDKLENGKYSHEVEPDIKFLVDALCAYEVSLQNAENELHRVENRLARTYK